MTRTNTPLAISALLILMLAAGLPVSGQNQSASGTETSAAPNEVAPGTRFLIRLQDPLGSKESKAGDHFTGQTITAIASADGTVLPAGAEIRGHVDRVEAAHNTGRAKMWLTFDDIQTPDGWAPLIAMVDDVPGVHSVRVNYNREGEIEASADKRKEALQAAAAGALVGAATGVASGDKKEAAMAAATAAAAAYMVSSGLGQELTLDKNTKLELILERSLYFPRT